jgi:hypothetical protein
MLEVPESKIMSRDCFRTDVVLPFTDILGEVSDQVGEPALGSGANLRVPACVQYTEYALKKLSFSLLNFVLSIPPTINSAPPTAFGVTNKLNNAGRRK